MKMIRRFMGCIREYKQPISSMRSKTAQRSAALSAWVLCSF